MAPTGAADPDGIADARFNAPLSVLTLGRVVSLIDFENFARAFSGIGKAHATWIWAEEKKIVFLTIASEAGRPVDIDSELYVNLNKAITKYKDPVSKFQIGSFILNIFNIKAGILIEDGYIFEKVKEEVESLLKAKFSFKERQFGQPVTSSEIYSLIHQVQGVRAVRIDALYLSQGLGKPNETIPSAIAHWDEKKKQVSLAELVIVNTIPGNAGSGI